MEKKLDAHFDRVEKALSSLVDSIAKYHPSISHGSELVIAETELTKGLEELQTHQRNHARLEQLRDLSTSLDNQIQDTLALLTSTRKELTAIPVTTFPQGVANNVDYGELLGFARRISKTSRPPASAIMDSSPADATHAVIKEALGLDTAVYTPAESPNGIVPGQQNGNKSYGATANGNSDSQPSLQSGSLEPSGSAESRIPQEVHAHLNPLSTVDFLPWPSEGEVRIGALANLAYLIGRGIDPESYDPIAEEARKKREEEAERAREETERQEREEQERKLREQRERNRVEMEKRLQKQREHDEAWRRTSVSASPTGEKKQFQFMDDDDVSD